MDLEAKIVLGYWAIRGLAQSIRFFLNYVGLSFEEKRYTDVDEWFLVDKPALASLSANIPYLKIGNTTVFQSEAIYFAIAEKVNRQDVVGKDLHTMVNIAFVRSILSDIYDIIIPLVYDKSNFETKKAEVLGKIASKFAILDQILEKSKWLSGEDLTYVDFKFFEFADEVKTIDQQTFDGFKNIVSFHTRFLEVPQNKAYTQSKDYIDRPYNNLLHGGVL